MKIKIGMVSLGCPKNLVDSEIMLGLLKNNNNYEITNNEKDADAIIVNTCGFVESAKKESIETILEMAEYKKERLKTLVVTGCLAQRYKDELLKEIPEIDAVIGTGGYGDIADVLNRAFSGEKPLELKNGDLLYLENDRLLSTGKGYAYLKISEGCDNCCTYCVIPSLRGPYRSRKIEDILKEARSLVSQGVREIILVAQDTTRYGTDNYGRPMLVEFLKKLSEIEELFWIRLLYCYPEMIDDSLINEIATNNKVCKYLDIPLQHASDKILKAMNRRGTRNDIENLLSKIRARIPGIVIRTSLIVGFPGESDEDFSILYDFVDKNKFDRLGVFTYSKEEGTAAFNMKPQIDKRQKNRRYKKIMELQKQITNNLNKERIGKVYDVLVEGVAEDGIFYYGRSYQEAPDIDGTIYFTSRMPLNSGEYVGVKVINSDNYDLTGDVFDESGQ
ncbi:MAG TPA: 30S ribosomal protein S12 methylthiotransferase RimO [Clostridia bacterium]